MVVVTKVVWWKNGKGGGETTNGKGGGEMTMVESGASDDENVVVVMNVVVEHDGEITIVGTVVVALKR